MQRCYDHRDWGNLIAGTGFPSTFRVPGDWDRPRRDRPRRDRPDEVTLSGVITGEGVECPAMRGRDGQLYTLAGNVGDFEPGDRVQVQGRVAEASFCMQGTTIEVRRMRHRG